MRSFRTRLLVFGYPLLELVTAFAIAQWIGWGWMLLLVIAGFPVGFAVMRNAGEAAFRDMSRAANTGVQVDPSRHGLGFVGGVLIAIPGFWTDLLGLLLVVPPTQRLFRQSARTWFSTRFGSVHMPGIRYPSEDVIQGTVIHRDPDGGTPPPGSPRQIE